MELGLNRFEALVESGEDLREIVKQLELELKEILDKTDVFESALYAQIVDLVIEEQELALVYKKMKRDKKEKRKEQKLRNKPMEKDVLVRKILPRTQEVTINDIEKEKERKRLYREAMLQVHPDKFSMMDESVDLATELTAKLVEVYQSGDLERLRLYHSHIVSGGAMLGEKKLKTETPISDTFLKHEVARLTKAIEEARVVHTYIVLTTYDVPIRFADELKAYYKDRIAKLLKRTRKVRKV